MAFNGSGTFNRLYTWTDDRDNSIAISAARMDAEQDGIATALSTCITKDGQTTITANIPMASYKFTGLGNGSARTDSIALGQVQDNTYQYLGTSGGSADTYTATPSPVLTAYATGAEYLIDFHAANTGASTLNVNAVSADNIKKYNLSGTKVDLENGDIQTQIHKLTYDGTDWVLLDPKSTSGFSATISSQAITTGVTTLLQFDTKAYDANSDYDNTTNYRHTPTIAGRYIYTVSAKIDDLAADAKLAVSLRKNGTIISQTSFMKGGTGTNDSGLSTAVVADMNGSTDYMDSSLFHEHGSNRDIITTSTRFTGQLIRND